MSHIASVYIKDKRDSSKLVAIGLMEDAVWASLEADWLSWLASGTPKGGSYPYVLHEGGRGKVPGTFLLNFEEIKIIT